MKPLRLTTRTADFDERLSALTAWSAIHDLDVRDRVAAILADVRARGDAALVELTNRFDRRNVGSMNELILDHAQLQAALARIERIDRRLMVASHA